MADNLTFTVNQKGPTDGGAPAVTAGITTRSFLVVAWYSSAETDNDKAGWVLTIPANWENHLADQITIPVVKPIRNSHVLPVDHYSLYYQDAASFTLGSVANKVDTITTTNETATTISIVSGVLTSSSTATFGTSMTNFTTLDGLMRNFKGVPRQNSTKAGDGTMQKKSWAADLLYEMLNMTFGMTTTTGANWRKVMKWQKHSIPIQITDNSTNKFIATYDGNYISSEYPGNDGMNPDPTTPLQFQVEAEVEA